ncbi:MAG: diaminopropionate ammonia-lyase [Acetobacteraceae bacterium]|nr:diaminopropionate ammonia-lyase [Acetobacteraceae bacterium]
MPVAVKPCSRPLPFRLTLNRFRGRAGRAVLDEAGFAEAKAAITAWPGYEPTPLHDLPGLAAVLRVAAIRWKDEGARFGLGSFKALGGAYAVARHLRRWLADHGIDPTDADLAAGRFADRTKGITVTCATDGNHGRAVAWGAARFHCRAVVFVHATVSAGRAEAIARFGAEVRRAGATYDDAVRLCAETAAREGWTVISDTSWPGYEDIPRAVMQGYRLMAEEAFAQWRGDPPTHVFIQAGVGGAAAAVAAEAAAHLR